MRNVLLAVVGLAVFAGVAATAPVPKALKKKPLRATIDPLPGEKVYSVNFDDVPFAKVAERLEQLTGLMYLSKDVPNLNITLKAEKVCAAELFTQLDELLYPDGWVVILKSQYFAVVPINEPFGDRKFISAVTPANLARILPHQPYQMALDLDDVGMKAGLAVGKKLNSLEVWSGLNKLYLVGNGESLRAFVAEMGDHIKK